MPRLLNHAVSVEQFAGYTERNYNDNIKLSNSHPTGIRSLFTPASLIYYSVILKAKLFPLCFI